MSRCCSSTCCRNSDTCDCRSSFSCRSRRCRANHFSSSLVRWMSRAVAALLPGREKMPWLERRLGTVWWGAGAGCKGCCTGLGACRPTSFSFSVGGERTSHHSRIPAPGPAGSCPSYPGEHATLWKGSAHDQDNYKGPHERFQEACALSRGKCGHWQALLPPGPGTVDLQRVLGRLELGSEEQVVRFLGIMQAVVKQPLIKVNYLFL